jgi:hypothetical protein
VLLLVGLGQLRLPKFRLSFVRVIMYSSIHTYEWSSVPRRTAKRIGIEIDSNDLCRSRCIIVSID